ncbi:MULTISPECIES: sugar ABC transporter ATP-binding protein [Parageobacillus]|uniref:Autoinducer 2 import ATP-binding protein LsrA n=2 Tax=Parageobacillus TaxID=1906945 RepID=A0A1I0TPF6_9BACL|nr:MULTISPECIES: sugar ABC transporter ATP-binding protein [Parageobacillus]RDE27907.1 sugar ABC transporter ATP-binding protein [Parageobacillus thermoglucosidasius]RDE34208.1 sugar ABC transporter ATP-binding protein [Parageobacillus thermoglucosidasius]SFA53637.1 monosaccharide ABC transporter ATP-binding protein, CUT2 family [Parageobacillus thermantarcticus]
MNGLYMNNIYKSFGTVNVLNGVNFDVRQGEVHALLGMNGAGKSTLMKILAGVLSPDNGTIAIDGKEYRFSSPADAKKAGIGLVVQEVDTALFPSLSVYENIAADEIVATKQKPILSWKQQKQRAAELLRRVGLSISLNKLIRECTLHEKQLIVLAKVLSSSARYIILDEPTAALSETETKRLFAIISDLKTQGVSFIYISHKLKEVKEICDRVTILRDGNVVHHGDVSALSLEEMIHYMVGRPYTTVQKEARAYSEDVLFKVKQLHIAKTNTTVDLQIHKGEIAGIAGLVGAGKTELAESLISHTKTAGEWWIDGKRYTFSSPKEAIAAGICLIPEERRKQGLFLDETVRTNLTVRLLSSLTKWQWVLRKKETQTAQQLVEALQIHPPFPQAAVKQLSGGNQQKVVIGKWLKTDARVFIFDEPTKGIDVNAKQEVFSIIRSLADEGKAVLYLTSEFQELLDIADTIYIMVDGQLVKRVSARDITYEQLIYYCSGGDLDGATVRFDRQEKANAVSS